AGSPLSDTAPTKDPGRPSREEQGLAQRGLVMLFPRQLDGAAPHWRIDRPTTVGRGREPALQLADDRVSRAHAEVLPHSRGVFVQDCDSRHGVFVDGKRVSGGVVAPFGSLIRFGDTLFLVARDVEHHGAEARRLEGMIEGGSVALAGPDLARAWDEAVRVASLHDPVLVLGESGSGKECIARIVHRAHGGPFVALNVAAIPPALFEAELFGYERGAFTGATSASAGAFRAASGGVLFLDEIGELSFDLQAKLLRAIDTKQVRPLGASRDFVVETRIVSATSRDLRASCRDGTFRMDLYYRLAGIIVEVPPLHERRDDVILLALSFLSERSAGLFLSADAAEALALARWEGNVRNLRYALTYAIGRATSANRQEIRIADLPELSPMHEGHPALNEERIRSAMKAAGGVAAHAAAALGISRTTLYNTMRRLQMDMPALRGEKGPREGASAELSSTKRSEEDRSTGARRRR
ncbi:MAG: sigma 54-interacting transcriptional regulator, partial [Polyangiaceae bacterium]